MKKLLFMILFAGSIFGVYDAGDFKTSIAQLDEIYEKLLNFKESKKLKNIVSKPSSLRPKKKFDCKPLSQLPLTIVEIAWDLEKNMKSILKEPKEVSGGQNENEYYCVHTKNFFTDKGEGFRQELEELFTIYNDFKALIQELSYKYNIPINCISLSEYQKGCTWLDDFYYLMRDNITDFDVKDIEGNIVEICKLEAKYDYFLPLVGYFKNIINIMALYNDCGNIEEEIEVYSPYLLQAGRVFDPKKQESVIKLSQKINDFAYSKFKLVTDLLKINKDIISLPLVSNLEGFCLIDSVTSEIIKADCQNYTQQKNILKKILFEEDKLKIVNLLKNLLKIRLCSLQECNDILYFFNIVNINDISQYFNIKLSNVSSSNDLIVKKIVKVDLLFQESRLKLKQIEVFKKEVELKNLKELVRRQKELRELSSWIMQTPMPQVPDYLESSQPIAKKQKLN